MCKITKILVYGQIFIILWVNRVPNVISLLLYRESHCFLAVAKTVYEGNI